MSCLTDARLHSFHASTIPLIPLLLNYKVNLDLGGLDLWRTTLGAYRRLDVLQHNPAARVLYLTYTSHRVDYARELVQALAPQVFTSRTIGETSVYFTRLHDLCQIVAENTSEPTAR